MNKRLLCFMIISPYNVTMDHNTTSTKSITYLISVQKIELEVSSIRDTICYLHCNHTSSNLSKIHLPRIFSSVQLSFPKLKFAQHQLYTRQCGIRAMDHKYSHFDRFLPLHLCRMLRKCIYNKEFLLYLLILVLHIH